MPAPTMTIEPDAKNVKVDGSRVIFTEATSQSGNF